jgi:hypothetical protein
VEQSKLKNASAQVKLEELARRLIILVRDSGIKPDKDLESDIAQKIKEAEISYEDK